MINKVLGGPSGAGAVEGLPQACLEGGVKNPHQHAEFDQVIGDDLQIRPVDHGAQHEQRPQPQRNQAAEPEDKILPAGEFDKK